MKKLFGVLALVALGGASLGFGVYEDDLVYKVAHVEAGVNVSATDFLKNEGDEAEFTQDSDVIDVSVPGQYNLKVKTGLFAHDCTLYVDDTIAPTVTTQDVKIGYGDTCSAEDFVLTISDATATSVAFASEPDYSLTGSQNVEIAVTDAGNNTTVSTATLMISSVLESLTIEVGSDAPDVSDFILAGDGGYFITDIENINYYKPGSYKIKLNLYDTVYSVNLIIEDTVAPEFSVKNIDGFCIVKRNASDFVTSENDVTTVKYTFKEDPDLTKVGTQNLTIIGTDEGGNKTEHDVVLTLKEDTEAPVITGAVDRTVIVKGSISYKSGVTVTDNCPDELSFTVDASKVNLNSPGDYPVTYTATDAAGNTTSESITVTVKERVYSEAEVNSMADAILASIITDGMSLYDKADAIFKYIRSHVSYTSESEKGNYIRAAYEGFVDKKGDCYVYASVSKVLLTRAGVPNMDIERIPSGSSMHYWNLVDIGDGHGWYHFDTTPRKDKPYIFLWTDAQIKAYSDAHNNCHNYDRSLYPTIY